MWPRAQKTRSRLQNWLQLLDFGPNIGVITCWNWGDMFHLVEFCYMAQAFFKCCHWLVKPLQWLRNSPNLDMDKCLFCWHNLILTQMQQNHKTAWIWLRRHFEGTNVQVVLLDVQEHSILNTICQVVLLEKARLVKPNCFSLHFSTIMYYRYPGLYMCSKYLSFSTAIGWLASWAMPWFVARNADAETVCTMATAIASANTAQN